MTDESTPHSTAVSAIAQERDVGKPTAYMAFSNSRPISRWLQWSPIVADADAGLVTIVPLFTTSPKAISEAPTSAEAVKPTPSIEVGEMVESLKTQAIWVTAYADGDDTSIPPTLEAACGSISRVSREAASLLIALDAERARLQEALKPFAEALKGNWSHQQDTSSIVAGLHSNDLRLTFLLGDFRRARSALPASDEG